MCTCSSRFTTKHNIILTLFKPLTYEIVQHRLRFSGMADLSAKWTSRLSAFEELTQKWRHVGLGALQRTTLDADALLLTANKESLAHGRKNLGSKTKEFAQLPNDQKLANFGSLLKCYQGYVDELTRFLSEAERCYFNLHGSVQLMVDPFPLMDRFSKEKHTLLEFVKGYEESESLRRALKDRDEELIGLNNQEATIANLRAQLAEAELSAMASAAKTASSTQEELNAILSQWTLREGELRQELQRALSDQRRSEGEVKELGNMLAVAKMKYSELEELRDSETSALATELEEAAIQSRLNARELERLRFSEKELKKTIASLPDTDTCRLNDGGVLGAAGLDVDDVNYVAALSHDLQTAKDECANLRVRCSLLEKEVEKFSSTASTKSGTLISTSIVQLQSALEESRDDVRRLNEDLDSKDRLLIGLRSRLETAQSDLIAREAELSVLRGKCKKMEEEKQPLLAAIRDLERELGGRKSGLEGNGTSPLPAAFDLASVLVRAPGKPEPGKELRQDPVQTSDDAFFAVTTQRDRLRQRLLALEEAASQEVEQLRATLKVVRDERDELLLQHNNSRSIESTGFSLRMPSATTDLYSPQQKRRRVVTALDMLTVLLYKHILSDLWMRRVFLGYLALLHLFVFLVLFYQASGFF